MFFPRSGQERASHMSLRVSELKQGKCELVQRSAVKYYWLLTIDTFFVWNFYFCFSVGLAELFNVNNDPIFHKKMFILAVLRRVQEVVFVAESLI